MSSMFDSNVRDRRNHTEWAVMSFTAFMKDMAIMLIGILAKGLIRPLRFPVAIVLTLPLVSGILFTGLMSEGMSIQRKRKNLICACGVPLRWKYGQEQSQMSL